MNCCIYKPPEHPEKPEESKISVKFSNNIYLDESFLKKNNIDYRPEDLEDTPLGKRYVIRREKEVDEL